MRYPLDTRLREPESQSACCEEEENIYSCQILNPQFSSLLIIKLTRCTNFSNSFLE